MNNFKRIQSMTIDELAEWLDENGQFDTSPWSELFSKKYCNNCESIKCKYADTEEKLGITQFSYSGEIECAYCELEKNCRFFTGLDDVPDNREVIRMWLEEEADEKLS